VVITNQYNEQWECDNRSKNVGPLQGQIPRIFVENTRRLNKLCTANEQQRKGV
jgi:hypothetical protein